MKTSIILPILAFFTTNILADVPPPCLLSAVNTQDSPSNLSAICGKEAIDVQQAIASLCSGSAVSVAQSAFISTCSVAGSSVAPYTAKPSSNATTRGGTYIYTTAVYNSDCNCTTTIVTAATTGAGVTTGVPIATSSSSSPSGSGASASGNAAADKQQVGSFAAAVIAIAGVVAVL